MSTTSDMRYGRQGGRWLTSPPGTLATDIAAVRAKHGAPALIDPARHFHPETTAQARAHDQQCTRRHTDGEACTAIVEPADLDAIWRGLARMAAARRDAGQPITALDRQALAYVSTPDSSS